MAHKVGSPSFVTVALLKDCPEIDAIHSAIKMESARSQKHIDELKKQVVASADAANKQNTDNWKKISGVLKERGLLPDWYTFEKCDIRIQDGAIAVGANDDACDCPACTLARTIRGLFS